LQTASTTPSPQKRADIQGLRMVAVVAVVINHLTGHPRGGFVGVDVFFVISGYLITSHLLRDLGRTRGPRQYIGNFYRKRVRRLLPAALAVTVLTIVLSRSIFAAARYRDTWHDGIWATVFAANWRLISQSRNYFAADTPPSPFQHYWSLSVEEQFYLVWPIVLFVVGAILVRNAKVHGDAARMRTGALAAAGLCVASIAWAVSQSHSDPTAAYFSTFTRAWELGLGAALACLGARLRGSSTALSAMSWAGLGMIVVSLFTTTGGRGFPIPGALLSCIGAAIVIFAYRPGATTHNILLTNPLSVFVGDISYSVYLVHFPAIVLLTALMPGAGAYYYVAAVMATVGASLLLYVVVERPVLASHWLLPGPKNPENPNPISDALRSHRDQALAGLAAIVIMLGSLAVWPGSQASQRQQELIAAAVAQPTQAAHHKKHLPPQLSAIQAKLRAALQAEQWPHLSPSYDAVMSGELGVPGTGPCGSPSLAPASSCTWGSPTPSHVMELAGDSEALVWVPALKYVVSRHAGWAIRDAASTDCSFASRAILVGPRKKTCEARNRQLVSEIKQTQPDLLVVTNVSTSDESFRYIKEELQAVSASVGHIVILGAPPPARDPSVCDTKGSTPVACVSQETLAYEVSVRNSEQMAADLGATFIDVTDWVCVRTYCPAFVGVTPTRFNGHHLSSAYATELGPVANEAFIRAGVFGRKAAGN
jgi:peptidoglycan/LPS O-acetylase OafA/YrhL